MLLEWVSVEAWSPRPHFPGGTALRPELYWVGSILCVCVCVRGRRLRKKYNKTFKAIQPSFPSTAGEWWGFRRAGPGAGRIAGRRPPQNKQMDRRDRNRLCARPASCAVTGSPCAASARAPCRRPGDPRPGSPARPPPCSAEGFLKLINETRFIYGPIPEQALCKRPSLVPRNERMGRFKRARREKGGKLEFRRLT